MAYINYPGRILVLLTVLNSCSGTSINIHESILDVLSSNGFKIFASWCKETLPGLYGGSGNITVFAFNDNLFTTMPSAKRARLMNLTLEEKNEYVQTYTLINEVNDGQLIDSSTRISLNGKDLFINKRSRVYQKLGGTTGTIATFINGAMILGQIRASNGIIHVLDRPLGLISDANIYQWLMNPEDPTVQTTIWRDLAAKLYEDSRYFLEVIAPIAQNDKITFFLPSENALRKIPGSKLQNLKGKELANIFKMHYIKNHVVYTTYVEHQESYDTAYPVSRVVFMRQSNGRVLVKSGGVTAMIERGNITVRNGVIHIIDRMFGFVYNSAREQIKQDAPTFNNLINITSVIVKSWIIQPSFVNMFVPTEDAFAHVMNLRGVHFHTNVSLVNYVVRLCMIKDGSIEVSQINGNYDVRQRRYTRYNNSILVVYNDKNESWVNAGNVRARIVRPDVKVTNGLLQYIDAVPGVPSYDIPSLIYYDDYLIKTYMDFKSVGLIDYLKDQNFDQDGNGVNNVGSNHRSGVFRKDNTIQNQTSFERGSSYHKTCGDAARPCQFTVFVPNGTAIKNYNMTSPGNIITRDLPRYRWVLERLVIPDQLIFLEQMPVTSQVIKCVALNGDELFLRKETENIIRLSWGNMSARLIMWDLGATNGVVHIIDTVLSSSSDRNADISSSHVNQYIIG